MKLNENSAETVHVHNKYSILTPSCDEENVDIVMTKKGQGLHKPHRTRRGFNKNQYMKRQGASALKILATNCAGAGGKVKSLKSEVNHAKANLVILQETHSKRKGKIQFPDMVVFEAIRKTKGGGTLIASHKDLNPKLIQDYEEEFELLVVEIEIKGKHIRVISGYGPQENWAEEKRMPFFIALETELEKAQLAGKSIIVEMDANSKLGPQYIPKDPHAISPNGLILASVVERQQLAVANGNIKCKGTITRKRTTKKRVEQSVIDIVLLSKDMEETLVEMEIDEDRKFVLTKVAKTKNGVKVHHSDHNTILVEFNIMLEKHKHEKLEIYALKNKESQEKFKTYTSNTNMLSSIFNSDKDIDTLTNRFLKKLDGCIAKSFRKIKVNQVTKDGEDKYDKLRYLRTKSDNKNKEEINVVLNEIADEEEKRFNIVKDEVGKLKPNDNGMNAKSLWKLKKKLCPKVKDPPTAMLDDKGNLLTSETAIQNRALDVFSKRLKNNDIEDDLKDLEKDTNKLCKLRLKLSKNNKSEPWTLEDLKYAVKGLGKDKSRDADGYANELFTLEVAGEDLLLAVLCLLNRIKEEQVFPKAFQKCTLTPIHKKKSKNTFDNYRGVLE